MPANSTSVRLQLLFLPTRFSSLEVAPHPRKTLVFISQSRTKSITNAPWMSPATRTPLLCARVTSSFLEDFQANRDSTRSRSISSRRTSGLKWRWWKTNATTWVRAPSMTNSSMRLAVSSAALSKRSTTQSKFTKSKRTLGLFWQFEWK